MAVDLKPLLERSVKIKEFAAPLTKDDLRDLTNEASDILREIISGCSDAQLAFEPEDPDANDPDAASDDEQKIGWSVAHLVLHVTASSEEGAAMSALLARGVEPEGRLRYEPDWRELTTKDQALHRIEESRRMRLAELETWPDKPHLDIFRPLPEDPRYDRRRNQMNAFGSFIFGVMHEYGHHDQIRRVVSEAAAAL